MTEPVLVLSSLHLCNMRCAIVAGIHGNLMALQAVLENIALGGPVEEVWCLGEVIGFGPAPNECIQFLQSYSHICIAGNHDWPATGRLDVSDFNPEAKAAVLWTASQLARRASPATVTTGQVT